MGGVAASRRRPAVPEGLLDPAELVPARLRPRRARGGARAARAAVRRHRDRRLLRDEIRAGPHARRLRDDCQRLLRVLRRRGRSRLALLPLALVRVDRAVRGRGGARVLRAGPGEALAQPRLAAAARDLSAHLRVPRRVRAQHHGHEPRASLRDLAVAGGAGLRARAGGVRDRRARAGRGARAGWALARAGARRPRRAGHAGLPARFARARLRERLAAVPGRAVPLCGDGRRQPRAALRLRAVAALRACELGAARDERGARRSARGPATRGRPGAHANRLLRHARRLRTADHRRARRVPHARPAATPISSPSWSGAGLLAEIPRPHVGFASRQEFVYQNFGESYLLEFSAPRWIQCAYNPPFEDEPGEEPDPEDGEDLGGAWCCPQKPPELW